MRSNRLASLHAYLASFTALLFLAPIAPIADAQARWIENRGQWPSRAEFVASLPGAVGIAEVGGIGVVVRGREQDVYLRLVFEGTEEGVEHGPCWEGRGALQGLHHFLVGNDPARWARGASAFGTLVRREAWPGVDVVLGVRDGRLKYDLHVAPEAELDAIRLRVEGARTVDVGEDGLARIETAAGEVRQPLGRSWEVLRDGGTRPVECAWRVTHDGRLAVSCPGRDPGLPLVIDPELAWSTYLGSTAGAGGDGHGGITRSAHEVVVVGDTNGLGFPHTPGAFRNVPNAQSWPNSVVTKFREPDGAIVFSTILGATGSDGGTDVALDADGNVYVCGWLQGNDFPVTRGAFDTQRSGSPRAGYLAKLSADGSELLFATYLEGEIFPAEVTGVVVDELGRPIVTGHAGATFPTTAGSFDPIGSGGQDAFVTRLDTTGSVQEWSTRLGGVGGQFGGKLALAPDGSVAVTGRTFSPSFPTTPGAYLETTLSTAWHAFVTRLTPEGDALIWSSLLGGTENLHSTIGRAVDVDAHGLVTVAGVTETPTFPTTLGAFQEQAPTGDNGGSFVTRFNADGSDLLYSTFFGGAAGTSVHGVDVDASGVPTISGHSSPGMPVTRGAYDTGHAGVGSDLFVARLSPQGDRLFYATYIGGPSSERSGGLAMLDTDPARVSITGSCFWPGGYPTTAGAPFPDFQGGDTDLVVTTLDLRLAGLESFGDSVPSCLGPIHLDATRVPAAGEEAFSLYASGAPPGAAGWLVVSTRRRHLTDALAGDPLLVDPASGRRLPAVADATGFVEVPLPLTELEPADVLYAQLLFDNPATCPGPAARSTSVGLKIVVQP